MRSLLLASLDVFGFIWCHVFLSQKAILRPCLQLNVKNETNGRKQICPQWGFHFITHFVFIYSVFTQSNSDWDKIHSQLHILVKTFSRLSQHWLLMLTTSIQYFKCQVSQLRTLPKDKHKLHYWSTSSLNDDVTGGGDFLIWVSSQRRRVPDVCYLCDSQTGRQFQLDGIDFPAWINCNETRRSGRAAWPAC